MYWSPKITISRFTDRATQVATIRGFKSNAHRSPLHPGRFAQQRPCGPQVVPTSATTDKKCVNERKKGVESLSMRVKARISFDNVFKKTEHIFLPYRSEKTNKVIWWRVDLKTMQNCATKQTDVSALLMRVSAKKRTQQRPTSPYQGYGDEQQYPS